MHKQFPPTRLWPAQTRVIHACAGLRLRVIRGRFWLTQPHAEQDLFLEAGAEVELMQDWVVIGTDAQPASAGPDVYSEYIIFPTAVESDRLPLSTQIKRWLPRWLIAQRSRLLPG